MSNDSVTPPEQRSRLRRLVNRMEIDRATFFALAVRAWQLGGGVVSLLLIGWFFSPELRGYYFTFGSLLGWQAIFEFGFGIATTNVCSHEWSKLQLDENGRITGDANALSRLVNFGRLIAGWNALGSVGFITIVGAFGTIVLHDGGAEIAWQMPWGTVMVLAGLLFWMSPLNALLEGCNQVASVQRFRFVQATASSIALWTAVALGWGLWAAVASVGIRVLTNLAFFVLRYRRFFAPFMKSTDGECIPFRSEVWPLQWRLAVSGLTGFVTFALIVPVIKAYHGAELAGRMGMTWTLITAVQAASLAWVQTRVPLFGMLIAKNDFRELDRVFWKLTLISFAALSAGAIGITGGLFVLQNWFPEWGEKFLPIPPTLALLAGVLCFHLPQCQAMYLRAHKVDPLLLISTISNVAIGLAIWLGGTSHGPFGASIGYAATVAGFTLPATWLCTARFRQRVHHAK